VVVDGNLISSRTPQDLPAFMRAMIAAFQPDTAVTAEQDASYVGAPS